MHFKVDLLLALFFQKMLPSLECTLLGPKTQVSCPPPWQNDPILPGSSNKVLPIGPNTHKLSIPFLVPIGQCLALPYEKQILLFLVPSVDCAFLGHFTQASCPPRSQIDPTLPTPINRVYGVPSTTHDSPNCFPFFRLYWKFILWREIPKNNFAYFCPPIEFL